MCCFVLSDCWESCMKLFKDNYALEVLKSVLLKYDRIIWGNRCGDWWQSFGITCAFTSSFLNMSARTSSGSTLKIAFSKAGCKRKRVCQYQLTSTLVQRCVRNSYRDQRPRSENFVKLERQSLQKQYSFRPWRFEWLLDPRPQEPQCTRNSFAQRSQCQPNHVYANKKEVPKYSSEKNNREQAATHVVERNGDTYQTMLDHFVYSLLTGQKTVSIPWYREEYHNLWTNMSPVTCSKGLMPIL